MVARSKCLSCTTCDLAYRAARQVWPHQIRPRPSKHSRFLAPLSLSSFRASRRLFAHQPTRYFRLTDRDDDADDDVDEGEPMQNSIAAAVLQHFGFGFFCSVTRSVDGLTGMTFGSRRARAQEGQSAALNTVRSHGHLFLSTSNLRQEQGRRREYRV